MLRYRYTACFGQGGFALQKEWFHHKYNCITPVVLIVCSNYRGHGSEIVATTMMLAHEQAAGVVVGLPICVRVNPSFLPISTKPISSPPCQVRKSRYWSNVTISLLKMVLFLTPTLAPADAIGAGYWGGGARSAGMVTVTVTLTTGTIVY